MGVGEGEGWSMGWQGAGEGEGWGLAGKGWGMQMIWIEDSLMKK